ncbi:MAG: PEGA domain-containing protein [Pseudomonadota bacterium]
MKSWMVFLFSLLFATSVVANPGNGKLTLVTDSPAQVSIDGKPVGRAPITKRSVTSGFHRIQYKSKALGSQFEFSVRVKADKQTTCTYSFETGENRCEEEGGAGAATKIGLTLTSEPMAEVFLDGNFIGKTPREKLELTPGHYKLEFRASGFQSVTKEVDVLEGQNMKVDVKLSAPGP